MKTNFPQYQPFNFHSEANEALNLTLKTVYTPLYPSRMFVFCALFAILVVKRGFCMSFFGRLLSQNVAESR
jgi:hypothetical protein